MSRPRQLSAFVAVGLVGFAAGLLVNGQRSVADPGPVPRVVVREDPPNRGLDANLWMQISAEYRACCYQAYNLARWRLTDKAHHVPPGGWAKPPAVVLDLDETVLDNGAFQARLLRNGLGYDQATWDDWEQNDSAQVRLVPGAQEFIAEAKRLGVTPVYITNRSQKAELRTGTLEALKHLGIEVPGDDLLCAANTSDKTDRRTAVEARYTVLLYLGDNLRDFFDGDFKSTVDNLRPGPKTTDPDRLRSAITARAAAVDRCEDLFGREWIILPNPAYGEWGKVLNLGGADRDRLTGQPPRKEPAE